MLYQSEPDKFIDGPLAGQLVRIEKPPIVMRIAIDGASWIMLSGEDERSAAGGKIVVYVGRGFSKHIRASRPEESGWVVRPGYRLLRWQPDDAILRDNRLWNVWFETNKGALLAYFSSDGEYELGPDVPVENPAGLISRLLGVFRRSLSKRSK